MIIKIGRRIFIIVGILMAIMTGGCRNSAPDARLAQLEEMGEKNPHEAYDSLVVINKHGLSKRYRMFCDFLSIKLADKSLIHHKSDSLILEVIDYYSHHGGKDRYTEALYYGGRVYSDIGDYPTALRYYGDALERTGNNHTGKLLKGKITSQMASLLQSMRLYNEAKKYVTSSIEIDKALKDTLNLMYDLELLGINNINSKCYTEAELNFLNALSIAERIDPTSTIIYSVYLACIKNYKMKPDSAVVLLGDVPYRADKLFKNDFDSRQMVYFYAADIYRCANMPDSAYKYALELIKIEDARNLRTGYSVLLSDALKEVVPQDSIRNYINRYRTLTEEYMNSNGDRSALIQNSLYNYSVVERDKEKALEKKRAVERWLAVSVILLLVLIIVVLYYRNKSNKTRLELHKVLERWHSLAEQLDSEHDEAQTATRTSEVEESVDDLRNRLTNELDSLCRSRKNRIPLSPIIADSPAYATLMTYIENQRTIGDANQLWNELHKVVLEASPNFDKRVQLLSGGNVKDIDLRIMLLIKCGVSPSQLSFLIAKSKATLSYHRKMLGSQWLDLEIDPRLIDNLIYSL